MVAPVPSQISSVPRNVRSPSTLNSFRILPVATGVGTLSPLVFQASSLPYPASSPNPRRLILLQTLLRSPKSQLLWNQANPNSLCKTRGVGGVRRLRASVPPWQIQRFSLAPLFSYSYKSLFPQPLSFHIHAKPRGVTLPTPYQEFLPPCALCLGGKSILFILLPPLLSLFALFSALVSFVFNRLQPLFRKHPGWGACVRNSG